MSTNSPAVLGAKAGYLSIVLHAHLPFVRHPENDYMLEENWYFEALTETYLPLLMHFDSLADDRVPFRITLSLSPTLCSMFADELLQERYAGYLSKRIQLAEKEVVRNAQNRDFAKIAAMYLDRFRHCALLYDDVYGRDLAGAFGNLQENGYLELITCSATHAFLPNMQHSPKAVEAQVRVAADAYRGFFGRQPQGMWLPECGFYPGLERVLDKEGIRFFIVDTHGVLFANPRPHYGVYAPIICNDAPVAAFGRDAESSRSVWSADEGYPGHPLYRDFYRDIGFDLDIDYVGPYIDPIGTRIQTGIKYYRITSKESPDNKQPYRRRDALRVADTHAGEFLAAREQQVANMGKLMDRPPLIVAPYDAELFGHWWFEGPEWLNYLIRKVAFEQDSIALVTPTDYLDRHTVNQTSEPSFSSWGEGGYSAMWLHESNDWIYRHLSRMEKRMSECASRFASAEGLQRRALNQMARELLLAESSDWAFIMKSGTMVNYAVRRTREHVANFNRLYEEVCAGAVDENFVEHLESSHAIFPDIDYMVYA